MINYSVFAQQTFCFPSTSDKLVLRQRQVTILALQYWQRKINELWSFQLSCKNLYIESNIIKRKRKRKKNAKLFPCPLAVFWFSVLFTLTATPLTSLAFSVHWQCSTMPWLWAHALLDFLSSDLGEGRACVHKHGSLQQEPKGNKNQQHGSLTSSSTAFWAYPIQCSRAT